jgi:transcriptional regulator with XRE-family HTH domain
VEITRVDLRTDEPPPPPPPEIRLTVRHRGFRWPFGEGDGLELWIGQELAGILPRSLILELIQHRLTDRLLTARLEAVLEGTPPRGSTAAVEPSRPRDLPPAPRRRAVTQTGRHWAVADRLRRARAAAGLTLVVLAEKAGTSRSTILRAERGACVPYGRALGRLAEVLGVSTDWVLSGRDGTETTTTPAAVMDGTVPAVTNPPPEAIPSAVETPRPPLVAPAVPTAPRRRGATWRGRHRAVRNRLDRARAVGDRLYRARATAGLTVRALAQKAGTSRGTVMRVARGAGLPRGQTLRRLAAALDVTVDWLLTGQKDDGTAPEP